MNFPFFDKLSIYKHISCHFFKAESQTDVQIESITLGEWRNGLVIRTNQGGVNYRSPNVPTHSHNG